METFNDFGLDTNLLNAIDSLGYDKPTEIQAQAIGPSINGIDIMGIAQTGSGKTAAFLIPLIKRLSEGKGKARMPRGLILSPTRELAAQIFNNFTKLSEGIRLKSTLIIGGTSYQEQKKSLDVGVDVIIGTPGRIYDHLERHNVMLHGIQYLVIDEADRMLDEGFIPQVEMICSRTSPMRQTLFFSATMNPEIEKLADDYLSAPLRIEVNPQASVSDDIEQLVYLVESRGSRDLFKKKRSVLRKIIAKFGEDLSNAIIFSNTKNNVDILQKSMRVHGYKSESIHGDHTQTARTEALTKFRNGDIQFLIASDVASRGLDIPKVSHVINLDVPSNPEDYIHRIGRTGRAGNKGTSITLCSMKEVKTLEAIENLIAQSLSKFKAVLKGRSQDLKIVPMDNEQRKEAETADETQLKEREEKTSYPKSKSKEQGQSSRNRTSVGLNETSTEALSETTSHTQERKSDQVLEDVVISDDNEPLVRRRWSYRKKDSSRRKSQQEFSSATGDNAVNADNDHPDDSSSEITTKSQRDDKNNRQAPGNTGQKEAKRPGRNPTKSKNRGFEDRIPAFVNYDFG